MKKGFTLIELLVVIAIIGILAGIVLVSVGTARNKAKDVSIKSNLANMRPAAEMYAEPDAAGNYVNFCNNTGTFGGAKFLSEANAQSGAINCTNSATAWAACGRLVTNTSAAWCVDSLGNSKQIAVGNCNTTMTNCQ